MCILMFVNKKHSMADTLGQKQSNGIWLKYSDSKLE